MSDVDSLDDGQFYEFDDGSSFPASGEKVPVEYTAVASMVVPGAPPWGRQAAMRRRERLPRASGPAAARGWRCGQAAGAAAGALAVGPRPTAVGWHRPAARGACASAWPAPRASQQR
jgi:hypothetical protein